jgi:pimeloyl-ACP methyl ester carboxylesterase
MKPITLRSLAFFVMAIGSMPTTASATPDLNVRPYMFVSAKGDSVAAEWGTLKVPENRSKSKTRTITLAFVRFPSTAKHPGPPIVYLAGGPGNSGISAARGTRFPLFMALRSVADVIALDPRGVGASEPALECEEKSDYPLDRSGDRNAWVSELRAKCVLCAQSWRTKGIDFEGYTVSESADDLDALRKVLGAEKITLWGISYGTTLGLEFMRRHPTHAYKAILAGIEGPDEMLKRPAQVDSMLLVISNLASRDSLVGRDVPDMAGTIRTQLQELDDHPVSVRIDDAWTKGSGDSVTVVLGPFDYRWALYQLLGTADYEWLPGFVWTFAKRDVLTLRWWAGIVAKERRSYIGSALAYCTDCASGASPARRAQVKAEAPKALLGDVANLSYPDVCDAWNVRELDDIFHRGPIHCSVPTLFISGTLDARTPPTQAENARKEFKTSFHLRIEGATHSDPLFLTPGVLDAMLEFLRTGRVTTLELQTPVHFRPVRTFND